MFKGFQKPKRLVANTETLTERYGMFIAQPFERGFGSTIRTGVRPVLLSSSAGAAPPAERVRRCHRHHPEPETGAFQDDGRGHPHRAPEGDDTGSGFERSDRD